MSKPVVCWTQGTGYVSTRLGYVGKIRIKMSAAGYMVEVFGNALGPRYNDIEVAKGAGLRAASRLLKKALGAVQDVIGDNDAEEARTPTGHSDGPDAPGPAAVP